MAKVSGGEAMRDLSALFDSGTTGALTDGQLLERFASGDNASAERAFEALVERHGPMVVRVCRSVLHDLHDAQDAAQATFLILASRACSVRRRDSVVSWLYGVAYRVACRLRASVARRRVHEQKYGELSVGVILPADGERWDEELMLHEELRRLPDVSRAVVVLCDLEGLSYEEVARQLACPVGTIKSRLARGRRKLRDRLTRRGLALSAGSIAVFTAGEALASLPPAWVASTARSASRFAVGRSMVVAGSETVIALAKREMTTMRMIEIRRIALALLVAGGLATGAGVLAQQGGGPPREVPRGGEDPVVPKVDLKGIFEREPPVGELPSAKNLAQRRVDAAREYLDASMTAFEQGSCTIDRMLEVSHRWMRARVDAADDHAGRLTAVEENVRLLRSVANRERSKLEVGNGSRLNLANAASSLADAETELRKLRDYKSDRTNSGR